MPFSYKNKKGITYYLHLRGPAKQEGKGKLYFFSKSQGTDVIEDMPDGYTIIENEKTGLPILKRK
ncbi:MAG: hypothetical protein J7604_04430 [Sporocytophaga sp.]|jgi:YHS domain-containing protein|uniref:Uncharacterized protein n=1 Tax=Sporocytophaga myxococcoides TaxID=153721 RepID=A0A098L914_9BACT|nr:MULTISPECIES: hypothetical protein [Sporocytophaga]MBO9699431.1 hypothetical protein [Sporocytophaga sp.]MCR6638468.1 hypothetical protein [Sporocytophaga sp.]GAL82824.1 hypothetical protein ACD_28C00409G0001 [Sporocytophaga myxococcoides]